MMRLGACLLLFFAAIPVARSQEKKPDHAGLIATIAKQGSGTAEGRAAWEQVSNAGPEVLAPLLKAMNGADAVAFNWLATAFDRVVDAAMKKGKDAVPLEPLLATVKDPTSAGKARRLALELAEKIKSGVATSLLASMLEDPEFRFEAVALRLHSAKSQLKAGNKDAALAAFQEAFAAARDVPQCRDAAVGLQEFNISAGVGRHFGFILDWYLIGPFDGFGKKTFTTIYPPEKAIDLKAAYEGQAGKVRWVRYQVKEPPHKSGAKHQALVDLTAKSALGDAEDAVAFAYAEFTVPAAMTAEFRGAADDGFLVYVNGKKVFELEEYYNGVRLDRHRFKAPLVTGKNTVLVKIWQAPPPSPAPNWEFFLRVVDESGKGVHLQSTLPEKK